MWEDRWKIWPWYLESLALALALRPKSLLISLCMCLFDCDTRICTSVHTFFCSIYAAINRCAFADASFTARLNADSCGCGTRTWSTGNGKCVGQTTDPYVRSALVVTARSFVEVFSWTEFISTVAKYARHVATALPPPAVLKSNAPVTPRRSLRCAGSGQAPVRWLPPFRWALKNSSSVCAARDAA